MDEAESKRKLPRDFAIPAAFIGKIKINLFPKKLLWFQAGLLMQAIPLQILMIIFFPTYIWNFTIWIISISITLLSLVFIRTVAGYFATGISVGFLVSYTSLQLANRIWLIAITLLAIIYLVRILLKYNETKKEYPLSTESNSTSCSILFLRPFHEEYANWARNLLIPVMDSYGRVTHVTDKSFENTPYGSVLSNDYRESYDSVMNSKDLSQADEDMFELVKLVTGGDPLYGQQFSNDQWKNQVEELLRKTDIAIIDVSKIGKGLQWELKTAFKILPAYRVILITCNFKKFKFEQNKLLEAIDSSGISPQWISLMEYNPHRPFFFIKRLHERMQQIISESLPIYQEKLNEDIKNQNLKSVVSTLQTIGDAYFGLDNFPLAKKHYEEALHIVEEHNLNHVGIFLISRLSRLATAMGDQAMESLYFSKMFNGRIHRTIAF